MDAKPLRTHIRSFRAYRIIGTIVTITGASLVMMLLFASLIFVLLKWPFASIYAGNAAFSEFMDAYGNVMIFSFLGAGVAMMAVFAAGIVFLALSTRSKIKDANRGIDYEELGK